MQAAFLLAFVAVTFIAQRRRRKPSEPVGDAGSGTPAGWYRDPSAPATIRYWNGEAWTPHRWVADTTPSWLLWTYRIALMVVFVVTWTTSRILGDIVFLVLFALLGIAALWRRLGRREPVGRPGEAGE